MAQTNTTTNALLSPQCFLYEAMADIMKYNNKKMQNYLELNQEQSKMLGGIGEDGAVATKNGHLQGGFYGRMLDTMEEAATKEAETMLDQAKGELTAGISSALGATLGIAASGASLYRSFGSSSETNQLSKFQTKFNTNEENLGIGEAPVNQEGIELQNLGNNNNMPQEEAINPQEQEAIARANQRAEEISASKAEMKKFMKDYQENPNPENQRILDSLKNNHKAEANQTIENLMKDSKENDSLFYNRMSGITQIAEMGSGAIGKIGKSIWDSTAAEVKEKAGKLQAQGGVIQSTVSDMQSTKTNSLQTASGYASSSTQAAAKYADIRV